MNRSLTGLRNRTASVVLVLTAVVVIGICGCQKATRLSTTATPSSTFAFPDINSITPLSTVLPSTDNLLPLNGYSLLLPNGCLFEAMTSDEKWFVINCTQTENDAYLGSQFFVSRKDSNEWVSLPSEHQYIIPNSDASFSPNNSLLVITDPSNNQIIIFSVGQWNVFKTVHFSTSERFGNPIWSPDNTSILMDVGNYGSMHNLAPEIGDKPILAEFTLDGMYHPLITWNELFNCGQKPSKHMPFGGYGPTWSPDGRKIAYISYSQCIPHPDFSEIISTVPEGNQLWIMDFTTGERTLLFTGDLGYDPVWSPDGRKIAFKQSVRVENTKIDHWLMNIFDIASKSIATIDLNLSGDICCTHFGGLSDQLDWSPDSNQIAFNFFSSDITKWGIYVVNSETQNNRKVVDYKGEPELIGWSTDGRGLIFEIYDTCTFYHLDISNN